MNAWTLRYDDFVPAQEKLREALCALGNGHFVTRGAAEESQADDVHYPGTYVAGGYSRLETEVAGHVVESEDLVNWPNWLFLTFRPESGEWLDLQRAQVLAHTQELDLRHGLLNRTAHIRDRDGRDTRLASRRLVHMGNPHLAAIERTITPLNWTGRVEVRSALDGRVCNAGVERYRALRGDHLEALETRRVGEDGILLRVQTRQSQIQMAQAARTQAFDDGDRLPAERTTWEESGYIEQDLIVEASEGRAIRIEKIVSLYTSRDRAIADCAYTATRNLLSASDFDELARTHADAWAFLWRRCDVGLDCDVRTQLILRLHIFHLLQTVSVHTIDLDAGVPARGLHGEAYRGHVFWDELFTFPFLNLRIPEITRALLHYRYRRLPEAKRAAAKSGYHGAMYPWQSGSDGQEVTQLLHLNPRSGRWNPDHTQLQRHINVAIVYNVWQYYLATEDREFLVFFGAEMVLEIAHFLASLATYSSERQRYEIRGVMGPDEFHDAYPDAQTPGLDNNAYTNLMVAWALWRVLAMLEDMPDARRQELCELVGISDEDLVRWDAISRKIFVPFHADGIISQFEGYEGLAELDWQRYRDTYGRIGRLDRILESEGDSPNRYKLSKQADVLMLFYLFSAEELTALFHRLGYPFDPGTIPRVIDYYVARTSDGSTLSDVVEAWVLTRSDRARSWETLSRALESDIGDVQGGTTPEGIHLGAMAGTVDILQRAYTGIEMRDGILWLNPSLPAPIACLRLRLRYRARWIDIGVTRDRLRVSLESGLDGLVQVGVGGVPYTFEMGQTREFPLEDA